VGPNYLKWGEIPGFIYDYSIDRYRRDPKVDQQLGLAPKEQSLTDQLTPIAAAAGGVALATEGAKQVVPAVKGLLGMGGATAGAEAAGAAGTAATTGAAGAAAAEGAAGAGAAGTTTGASLASAAPIAGVALAAGLAGRYGVRALQGKTKNWKDAPLADNLGRLALMAPTFGGSELYNYLGNKFSGDKDRWKTEGDRLRKLEAAGQKVPDGWREAMTLTGGRDNQDILPENQWKPEDLVGYAALAEKDPNWYSKSLDEQLKVAKKVIDAGAFREHHGTVDIDWSKVPQDAQAGVAPISADTAQGLLGIDAGTRKRWREQGRR